MFQVKFYKERSDNKVQGSQWECSRNLRMNSRFQQKKSTELILLIFKLGTETSCPERSRGISLRFIMSLVRGEYFCVKR